MNRSAPSSGTESIPEVLETLFRDASVGWIHLSAGAVRKANAAAARILYSTPEEMTGKSLKDVGLSERTGSASTSYDSVVLCPGGIEHTVHILELPLRQPGESAVLLCSPDPDAVSHAREHNASLLRQVIDINPCFIFVKDRGGRFTLVNQAVADVYGTTVEGLLGKADADFNPNPEEVDFFRRADLEVMDSLQEKWISQEVITDSTGRVRYLQTIKRPLVDPDGKARHVLGVSTDVTKLKEAEDERLKLEAQVQHTQKLESLGVLAGGIAHDFNNLLVGILGNADLAQMMLMHGSEARGPIEQIQFTAQRAADLCKQLLDYSGKGRFVVESADLTHIVEDITHLIKISVSKKAVLHLDLSRNLPPIDADTSQIRQVVMNLITNASDAVAGRSGVITVITGAADLSRKELDGFLLGKDLPEGVYIYIEVTDNGIGMDEKTRGRIFDPFFSTKFAGRGLGLAAVQGIVRGHRGAIHVASRPGEGTTVKVFFPAGEMGEKHPIRHVVAEKGVRGSGTVLVVDDEDTVRAVTRHILELAGFGVLTARDGPSGIELFRQKIDEVEAVLLDMTMPQMTGDEVLTVIRRLKPGVPVVVMSGYSESEAMGRFSGRDISAFLMKPFRAQDLIQCLRGIVERPKEKPAQG